MILAQTIVGFLLLQELHVASYDVFSVTPLFFLNFAIILFAIFLSIILLVLSCLIKDKVSFTIIALMTYFIVLYAPYFVLRFNIYNDQLGFIVEILSGYTSGYIAPYQGELTTLGHAFFSAIFGKILGLDVFSLVKYAEAVFIFIPFITYLSLVVRFFGKNIHRGIIFLSMLTLMSFPAFALEPLVYSRGYFGLILGLPLFLCMFNYIQRMGQSNSIIATIVFVTSSISYPLQPLIVIFSMIAFALISKIPTMNKRGGKASLSLLMPKILYFFVIWSFIQVFYGEATWKYLHEIILNILRQEYLTALEAVYSLEYVGDALIYVNLRIMMIITGWVMSVFIVLVLAAKARKGSSQFMIFTLSMLIVLGLLGTIYGVAFHEPGIRFYRTLVIAIPFALLNFVSHGEIKHLFSKISLSLLMLVVSIFLILSPVIKWGWIFIGYPTTGDIALANYVAYGDMPLSKSYIYAPGAHQLLDFIFIFNALSTGDVGKIGKYVSKGGDIEFSLETASSSEYIATFYRIYILPRWTGENINAMLTEIYNFASSNNLIYSNSGLHLLIERS
ncbi:MAG: hypothetical protein NZ903_02120 [Candidatus Micrarchaeota archaeon]|nr:hypothetical protein [Candidatus Micrarchaeota archaeon]